jgi:hypothetical protein
METPSRADLPRLDRERNRRKSIRSGLASDGDARIAKMKDRRGAHIWNTRPSTRWIWIAGRWWRHSIRCGTGRHDDAGCDAERGRDPGGGADGTEAELRSDEKPRSRLVMPKISYSHQRPLKEIIELARSTRRDARCFCYLIFPFLWVA